MGKAPSVRFRPHNILLAAIVAVAVGLFVVVNWPFVSSSRVLGVKIGMTEAEVTQVMGKPHHKSDYYWTWNRWPIHVVVVYFSPDGRVTEAFND